MYATTGIVIEHLVWAAGSARGLVYGMVISGREKNGPDLKSTTSMPNRRLHNLVSLIFLAPLGSYTARSSSALVGGPNARASWIFMTSGGSPGYVEYR